MKNFPLPRIDKDPILKNYLQKFCRLKTGEIWEDPFNKHKIACFDAIDENSIFNLVGNNKFQLAIHDPPYNMIAFEKWDSATFINWCKKWIDISDKILADNSSLYIWLGADQKNHFEPFAEFILMMKETESHQQERPEH